MDKTSKLFNYEMMDTPSLAGECHRLKFLIDEAAAELARVGGDTTYKRGLMADLKMAKAVLKSRQRKMF